MRYLLTAAAVLASPAWAHEYDEATISRIDRVAGGPTVEIIVPDTVSGQRLVCALYSDGVAVQSVQTSTNDLATKVMLNYADTFDRARCVYSDQ